MNADVLVPVAVSMTLINTNPVNGSGTSLFVFAPRRVQDACVKRCRRRMQETRVVDIAEPFRFRENLNREIVPFWISFVELQTREDNCMQFASSEMIAKYTSIEGK